MSDRRMTPANSRVAHISLRAGVTAERYVTGDRASVTAPLADLLTLPGGPRDRQVLMGETVLVLDRHEGYAFIQAEKDGYCGYLKLAVLGDDQPQSHWIASPATHLYSRASLKSPEIAALSHGVRLTIRGEKDGFLETDSGQFVPHQHVRRLGDWLTDPVAVAEGFLGTPYLWGGNSYSGIDCSGLVQAACLACGISCPGDSDHQLDILGTALSPGSPAQRGDLFFWPGHIAFAVDRDRIIHANAFRMAVTYEDTATAISRIDAQGEGPLLAQKRL